MSIGQQERPARLGTPLGADALVLHGLHGTERLSTPFEYRASCLSEDPNVDLEALIGQDVNVEIDAHGGTTREINAIVAGAAQVGSLGEYAAYELVLRPWFWLLTRTSDARIFTDLSVPDIVKTVLRDAGFTDFDDRLTASYPAWNFCVQYGESTADFLSRLMEHEGIYYRFVHEGGKHLMVLCDSISAHDAAPEYDSVPHYPVGEPQARERDHLADWRVERRVSTGRYAMRDFRFDAPTSDLLVKAFNPQGGAHDAFERYEYPAAIPNEASGALQRGYGERLARQRLEGEQAAHSVSSGGGDAAGLAAGRLFTLTGCARADQNREYLIVEAALSVELDSYFSGGADAAPVIACRVECIDSRQPYRPPLLTFKPRITGPQTAIVCGPKGEEIWTDSHGRVKLQFHWDRYGKRDEHSSCWVRVSQLWAGEGWGGIHLPRIGQEVIVEFVDGDPDRPLVTGRVYNGDRPVPYELPANATQSGIKSRSSKGGGKGNFNEIRMEDKKGEEELYLHAEKDQLTVVENDRGEAIGHDHSETVGNDKSIEVGRDHVEKIGRDMSLAVGRNRTESVGDDVDETVANFRRMKVGKDLSITVDVSMNEQVGSDRTENVGADRGIVVGGNQSAQVGKDERRDVGGDIATSIGKNLDLKVGGKSTTSVGDVAVINAKKIQLVANDEISFKAGGAEIVMKKNGDITIKGKKLFMKGSGDVVIKGSKVKAN